MLGWTFARSMAPLVENGLMSTMVAAIARAATNPPTWTSPDSRNGTARAMTTPMIARDDASAEIRPDM